MTTTKIWLRSLLPSFLISALTAILIKSYVAEGVVVPSGSMLPTIQLNDRFLIEKMVPITHFNFGDIVVFYPPIEDKTHERFIKRLIGLPGDLIEIKDGYLYRNGEKVDEPYIKEKMDYTFGPVSVPENHYLFLGDNRNVSLDSHMWDTPFVSRDKLVGKVVCRFYPLDEFSTMKVTATETADSHD
ncbi:signal peptidase I [Gorillibacterium massiliense]|uniref:signal peptidase I n=1 Tax=Gorillibacterium massiliense TaxID=1280390 RepID=UPI0004B60DBE|nr:signal peptidase I [Gorillibacterium massiliense]